MNSLLGIAAERLTGWDFLIAGAIVALVEWLIKPLLKKVPEKTYDMLIRIIPVVLGALVYVALFFIQKTGTWYASLLHGLMVGLTSMGSYQVILEAIKTSGAKGITDINEAVKEAVEKDR